MQRHHCNVLTSQGKGMLRSPKHSQRSSKLCFPPWLTQLLRPHQKGSSTRASLFLALKGCSSSCRLLNDQERSGLPLLWAWEGREVVLGGTALPFNNWNMFRTSFTGPLNWPQGNHSICTALEISCIFQLDYNSDSFYTKNCWHCHFLILLP